MLFRKRGPNELWLAPTNGKPARKLDVDGRDWAFGPYNQMSLHPDGGRLAFVSGRQQSTEVRVLENLLPVRAR